MVSTLERDEEAFCNNCNRYKKVVRIGLPFLTSDNVLTVKCVCSYCGRDIFKVLDD